MKTIIEGYISPQHKVYHSTKLAVVIAHARRGLLLRTSVSLSVTLRKQLKLNTLPAVSREHFDRLLPDFTSHPSELFGKDTLVSPPGLPGRTAASAPSSHITTPQV